MRENRGDGGADAFGAFDPGEAAEPAQYRAAAAAEGRVVRLG